MSWKSSGLRRLMQQKHNNDIGLNNVPKTTRIHVSKKSTLSDCIFSESAAVNLYSFKSFSAKCTLLLFLSVDPFMIIKCATRSEDLPALLAGKKHFFCVVVPVHL